MSMRRIIMNAAPRSLAAVRCASNVSPAEMSKAIEQSLAARKIFDPEMVSSGTAEFCNLNFDATYVDNFNQEDVISHAYGYLTALARSKYGSNFFYSKESETSAFYLSTSDYNSQLRAMRRLESFIDRTGLSATHAVSVRSYNAKNSDCVLYSVDISPFVNPKPKADELNTAVIGGTKYQSKNPVVVERNQSLMNRVFTSTTPTQHVSTLEDGTVVVTLAMLSDRKTYLPALSALVNEAKGAVITKRFMETFANGVHIYTLYVAGSTSQVVEQCLSRIAFLPNRPNNAITKLHESLILNAEVTIFAHCLITFAFYFTPAPVDEDYTAVRNLVKDNSTGVKRLNNLRATLSQEMMSERYMGELIEEFPELVKKIHADFIAGSTKESREAIAALVKKTLEDSGRSVHDKEIFSTFLLFNEAVLKHNFNRVDKAAFAFRLNPQFVKNLDYPRVPHGVFLFVGGHWRGFHVRFTEIARGGVRMIISNPASYKKNKMTVFQENYNLANTQLQKNKDIPEGGSKGTILVSSRYINKFEETKCKQLFLQYVDALLDVVIPGTEGVVDNMKKEEIIFLGPDENTAGSFPAAGALYSKQRGYSAWKSFTTGKDPFLGGIPHDTYGMTTRSVRQCVEGIYRKLNLDETTLTKFQTGGPDGDLGSNEILRSREKYIALSDVSACVHDPEGVNRDELARLAKARLQLKEFDPKKLGPKGFLVLATATDVTLPDGTFIHKGVDFRDTFFLTKYTEADVFVPCGGRPASVTLQNVHNFVKSDGVSGESMLAGKQEKLDRKDLKHRIIVEGANLFLTQDARLALEKSGAVIIKDATANKGGVTSSSLEVLTGLALSDEEHAKHMSAKNENDAPQFYKDLVKEICARVENNAHREFEAIWKAHLAQPGKPKTEICDELSEKIVLIRTNVLKSNIFADKQFLRFVIDTYTPKTIKTVVPVDTLLQRVPEAYLHAICAMWIASDYVYKYGSAGTEFDFFEHMQREFELARQSK